MPEALTHLGDPVPAAVGQIGPVGGDAARVQRDEPDADRALAMHLKVGYTR